MHWGMYDSQPGPRVLGARVGLVKWPSPSYLDAGSKLMWLTASQLHAGVRAGLWEIEHGAVQSTTRLDTFCGRCCEVSELGPCEGGFVWCLMWWSDC